MLEKTTRLNYLFDFYQSLLTEKQRNYMALYYLDDYSLGEIAEEFQVSRQAVYDNIKRTEAMLEDYEEKLLLFSKFQERTTVLTELRAQLSDQTQNDVQVILEKLENID
ncbi:hypothetical protein CIB95_03120 [Lottiidibacillus patelloidae]|uniref:UPF0122 protein CIB95_03120 n=1 Tax=Lottiidibacillus patelloidae TaxID=2670334 RepID=A0A263BXX6_9BACI|nr:putative DNA-binding protein [Lottiidibacillus patelloidae]OZM58575.1 hypothetical protein CIB95_03120 [Lottiidibacillus patelloidae]